MKINWKIVMVFILLIGLVGVTVLLDTKNSSKPETTPPTTVKDNTSSNSPAPTSTPATDVESKVLGFSPILGDKDAKMSIIEFMDSKCTSCKEWAESIYPELKKNYIDTGKAKIHVVDLAFIDSDSNLGATAGVEIYRQNPESYVKYYELIFKNSKGEEEQWITKEFLINLVTKNLPEINIDEFSKALDANAYTGNIDDLDKFANEKNVVGTPTFIINNQIVLEPNNYQMFVDMLEGKNPLLNKMKEMEVGTPVIGDKNAPVTIFQFVDYKCPFCQKWENEMFTKINQDYITTGKAKMYVFPLAFLGTDSIVGAMAAQGIYNKNPEGFATYHKKMFEKQGEESKEWITTDFIKQLISDDKIEVDATALEKELNDTIYRSVIEKYTTFAEYIQVSGTPAIFINGEKVTDTFNYETLKSKIEAGLK